MKTKQIIFTDRCVAELLEVEHPAPNADEITVEMEYSAISAGTERANFLGERSAIDTAEEDAATFPRMVGYSGAGIVVGVGADIQDVNIGDRVLAYGGMHRKLNNINKRRIIKIPDGISTAEASMAYISIFPLAAIRKTNLEIGESAMVMGLGILGIFAVQELRAAGAYPIIAVDPVAQRRDFAMKMGADYALDPTDSAFYDNVLLLSGGGVNVCIEVTGLGIGLIQALDCMKEMGRIALLGCTRSSKFEIDYYGKVHGRGISLIGAHTRARPKNDSSAGLWTTRDDLRSVLDLAKGKRLNFKDMICEVHSPEEAQEVYDRLAQDKKFPIGVLFDWREI